MKTTFKQFRARVYQWLGRNWKAYKVCFATCGNSALAIAASPFAVFVETTEGIVKCIGTYTRKRDAIRHYFSRHFRLNHSEAWIDNIVKQVCVQSILHNCCPE